MLLTPLSAMRHVARVSKSFSKPFSRYSQVRKRQALNSMNSNTSSRTRHVYLGCGHMMRCKKRTLWVVILYRVMMVGEIAAGYITGSMASASPMDFICYPCGVRWGSQLAAFCVCQAVNASRQLASVLAPAKWEIWVALLFALNSGNR